MSRGINLIPPDSFETLLYPRKTWDTTDKEAAFAECEKYEWALLDRAFDIRIEGVTTGYYPEFDAILDGGILVEVKISEGASPFIEIGQLPFKDSNGDITGATIPSGLSLSNSDLYLVLHRSTYNGNDIGKIRIFRTKDLRKALACCEIEDLGFKYGTQGFYLTRELILRAGIEDHWVGSVNYDKENNVFDISSQAGPRNQKLDAQSKFLKNLKK